MGQAPVPGRPLWRIQVWPPYYYAFCYATGRQRVARRGSKRLGRFVKPLQNVQKGHEPTEHGMGSGDLKHRGAMPVRVRIPPPVPSLCAARGRL
jgi:hypothetical protein